MQLFLDTCVPCIKQKTLNSSYTDINQQLVDECRQGSRKAQYMLYKLYAKAMFGTAMRILNNEAEAEDVLQEAFLDAFQKIEGFKGEATFGSWLKRIVINKSLNMLKKRKLEFKDIESYDFGDDSYTQQEQAETEAEKIKKFIRLYKNFQMVLEPCSLCT
ncbi:MAG: hypothetical protein OHK0045_06860 [Raineya sp.]